VDAHLTEFIDEQAWSDAEALRKKFQDTFGVDSNGRIKADLAAIGERQRELFLELVSAKCMELFNGEKSVAEWHGKIPTSTDMAALLARLYRIAKEAVPSMENARFCYSLSSLMTATDAGVGELQAELADLAFSRVAECMLKAQAESSLNLVVARWRRKEAEVRFPARVDFAGGWSDTPPHCLERGGAVLNAAVSLDGKLPIQASASILEAPVAIVESVDLGVRAECRTTESLVDFSNPRDPLALHKAALTMVLPGVGEGGALESALTMLGGGVHLRSKVLLPKGTGLGTSSILAAALVKSLLSLGGEPGREPSPELLYEAAAAIEQMLTTGGGWQDQVGGVFPGVKLTRSRPGYAQRVEIEPVAMSPRIRGELDDRIVVFDTGQRRLAKNLLRDIMGSWLRRDRRTVAILGDIKVLAEEGAEALSGGDFFQLGRILWRHWELNKQLDAGTSNPLIDSLMDSLRPHIEGAKLAGAGGGGFLLAVAKDGCKESIRRMLTEDFADSNVRYYDSAVVW
jgi:fucokinase